MDLRTYLQTLSGPDTGGPRGAGSDLARVDRRVDPNLEISALLQKLEDAGRLPVVHFTDVLDTRGEPAEAELVVNLFADRGRLADVLGGEVGRMAEVYGERTARRVPVREAAEAPVKENILTGEELDLRRLPIVTHHEKDAGPYLTSGVVLMRDPESGVYNGAIQRMQLQGPRELGIFMVPSGHNRAIYDRYSERGEDTPVAVVLGHHPAFFLGMQHKGSFEDDEYEIVGALLEEGVEVTPGVTDPRLAIPARAEIVIEGVIRRGELRPEGPFGEYTHYYSPQSRNHVIEARALLHRNRPIFHDIFACHPDHHYLEGVVMESQLLEAVRRSHPGVKALCLPPSGCCQFYCYVSLEKTGDDEPAELARTLLATNEYVKYVVVVDPDIDVFNENQVLWAVATRARTAVPGSFHLFTDLRGTAMDPSGSGKAPPRAAVDATFPTTADPPEPTRVSRELLERIELGAYGL